MGTQEIRKGTWSEQEDNLLANVVSLIGDRRWDFVAKVSGLKVAGDDNRTGKSCRLRWVNYLHPGLKQGKMTANEERLVRELHDKWGNRWSRIARKLPGRTDNEIKNYWRTYMRKQVQEQRKENFPSMGLSFSHSSSITPTIDSLSPETEKETVYDTGGLELDEESNTDSKKQEEEEIVDRGYTMDDIWKCLDMKKENLSPIPIFKLNDVLSAKGNFYCPPPVSPMKDNCFSSLWKTDDYHLTEAPSSESSITIYY